MTKMQLVTGFTLMELMIGIAITGITAAMVISLSVRTNLQKARDNRRMAELETIRNALEIYRSDTGQYPNASGNLPLAALSTALVPNYLAAIPPDPSGSTYLYYYQATNCTGSSCKGYLLCASLERIGGGGTCGATSNGCNTNGCNYQTTNP